MRYITYKYSAYKVMKQQQDYYFDKLVKKELELFWEEVKSCTDRIYLLRKYSQVKFNYTAELINRRKQFSNFKRKKCYKKKRNLPCWVCGNENTVPHHVIQLQNGGMNIKQNIVMICNECHAKVHPWLSTNVREEVL